MGYYLHAASTRYKGKRYVRGDELPDELGARLAESGLAVDDRAKLTDSADLRPGAYAAPLAAEQTSTGPAQTTGKALQVGPGGVLTAEPSQVPTDPDDVDEVETVKAATAPEGVIKVGPDGEPAKPAAEAKPASAPAKKAAPASRAGTGAK